MPFETLTGGMQITIPTDGTKNWGPQLKNLAWQKINDHQHTGLGDGNQLVEGSYTNFSISINKLKKNIGVFQATTLTPSSSPQAIDFDLGTKQVLDLSSMGGGLTVTFSNPISGATYRIKVIQAASPVVITWPAAVKWPQSTEPSQFWTGSSVNMVWLDYDGTNYLGSWEMSLG